MVTFRIDRELMHHIIQTYIPSGLIVTISFFSFWLDVDSVPGRVSLSITTILTGLFLKTIKNVTFKKPLFYN